MEDMKMVSNLHIIAALIMLVGSSVMVIFSAYRSIKKRRKELDEKHKTIKENEKIILNLETSQYEKDFNTLKKELEKYRNILSMVGPNIANMAKIPNSEYERNSDEKGYFFVPLTDFGKIPDFNGNIFAPGCFRNLMKTGWGIDPIYHTQQTYQHLVKGKIEVDPGIKWSDLKKFKPIVKPGCGGMSLNNSERKPVVFSTWINEVNSITQEAYEKLNSHNKNKKMKRSEIKVKVNTPEEAKFLRQALKIYGEGISGFFYTEGLIARQTHMIYDHVEKIWIIFHGEGEKEEIGVKEFIEIISGRGFDPEDKPKVAVEVLNKRQYDILCKHFDAHGWNLRNSNASLSKHKFPSGTSIYALHDDSIIMQEGSKDSFCPIKRGYKVLDFREFAKQNNLPCPEYVAMSEDGYPMYTGDGYYHAIKNYNKQWRLTSYQDGEYGGLSETDSVIKSNNSDKMFKTGAAAQEFIRIMNCSTTSEDGYELKRDDKYYFVSKRPHDDTWVYETEVSHITEASKVLDTKLYPDVRAFKFEKNAVEWCKKMNKPKSIALFEGKSDFVHRVRVETGVAWIEADCFHYGLNKAEIQQIIDTFDKVR